MQQLFKRTPIVAYHPALCYNYSAEKRIAFLIVGA